MPSSLVHNVNVWVLPLHVLLLLTFSLGGRRARFITLHYIPVVGKGRKEGEREALFAQDPVEERSWCGSRVEGRELYSKGASIRYDHTGGMPKRIVLELSYRGFVNLRASGIGGVKKRQKLCGRTSWKSPLTGSGGRRNNALLSMAMFYIHIPDSDSDPLESDCKLSIDENGLSAPSPPQFLFH